MSALIHRRNFLIRSSTAVAGLLLGGCAHRAISPNNKLNLGIIGVANRAADNLHGVSTENIVALCDVDANFLAAARQEFPRAAVFRDFRKMLDRTGLDAVVVSTPDHTHAVAAVEAMRRGLHVYCEKPLGRTVSEARRMAEVARQRRCVTQMGTQIHATENYQRVVAAIRGGVIGPVREVHVWSAASYTAAGLPKANPPAPASLDWELWLGPLAERPYSPDYLPETWRRWWAFGGGGLADFGCHYMDLPQWALDLRAPETIEAEGPPVQPEVTPPWLIVRYNFPARGVHPPVKLTWYNGIRDGIHVRPPLMVERPLPDWDSGVLFIGDKGMLVSGYFNYALLPEKNFPAPPKLDPEGGDYEKKHHQEWIQAIKTGGATSCNFDYAGALAETVQLGNAAFRSGGKIVWDPARLEAVNNPNAAQFIRHHYRSGWSLGS
jgi:predicted dehydrogenase